VYHVLISRQTWVPTARVLTDVGAETVLQLPFAASGHFAPLFAALDANLVGLGVRSYGISVTTLEEVFIKV
jgi:ATP-binding cassette subfamily A (ABC1) protein 3